MSHHPFSGGNNGGGGGFSEQKESNKISRNPEVNMNHQKSTSVGQGSTTSKLPVNRGTTHIFYKTRMCQKFADGNCRNGDKCTFAHGPKDLREPPPNWQEFVKDNRGGNWINDDQKIIQRMRICRKFYNGDQCPYGEKCTFLHESPDKFKVQTAIESGKTRENTSVITVDTVVDHGQSQTMVGQDRLAAGRVEGAVRPYVGSSLVAVNMDTGPIERVATGSASDDPVVPQRLGRGFLKLANKKLVGIYADWIDEEEDGLI